MGYHRDQYQLPAQPALWHLVYTRILGEMFDEGIGATRYIVFFFFGGGVYYCCKSGTPIRVGSQGFMIFSKD